MVLLTRSIKSTYIHHLLLDILGILHQNLKVKVRESISAHLHHISYSYHVAVAAAASLAARPSICPLIWCSSPLLIIPIIPNVGSTPTRPLGNISTYSLFGLPSSTSIPILFLMVLYSLQLSRYFSKRKLQSVGPPLASGWNCVEKMGRERWMIPSFE